MTASRQPRTLNELLKDKEILEHKLLPWLKMVVLPSTVILLFMRLALGTTAILDNVLLKNLYGLLFIFTVVAVSLLLFAYLFAFFTNAHITKMTTGKEPFIITKRAKIITSWLVDSAYQSIGLTMWSMVMILFGMVWYEFRLQESFDWVVLDTGEPLGRVVIDHDWITRNEQLIPVVIFSFLFSVVAVHVVNGIWLATDLWEDHKERKKSVIMTTS
jgi:hypothetical protein